jgi:hypothetical protein
VRKSPFGSEGERRIGRLKLRYEVRTPVLVPIKN